MNSATQSPYGVIRPCPDCQFRPQTSSGTQPICGTCLGSGRVICLPAKAALAAKEKQQ